jgi:hypothetical protein
MTVERGGGRCRSLQMCDLNTQAGESLPREEMFKWLKAKLLQKLA